MGPKKSLKPLHDQHHDLFRDLHHDFHESLRGSHPSGASAAAAALSVLHLNEKIIHAHPKEKHEHVKPLPKVAPRVNPFESVSSSASMGNILSSKQSIFSIKEEKKAKKNPKKVLQAFTKFLFKTERTIKTKYKEGLAALEGEDMVYLNPFFEFEEEHVKEARYELVNRIGDTIYYASHSNICCSRFLMCENKTFHVSIYDLFGNPVFEVIGPSNFFYLNLTVARVLFHDSIVGTIKKTGILKADFQLFDSNGKLKLSVKSGKLRPTEDDVFVIYSPNEGLEVGDICKNLLHTFHDDNNDMDDETTRANFDANYDNKLKMLVIGALFFIEFQFYNSSTSFSSGTAIFSGVALLFISLLVVVPLIMWIVNG